MGEYSPYPREINIYFLQGGVIYILLPREYRKEESQRIKNAREREKTGVKWSICEICGAIVRFWKFPFPVEFKGLLNISVAAAWLRRLLCRFCAFRPRLGLGD